MSSVFTISLLGSAVVVGSVLAGILAQDAKHAVKPCIGESCPRKSPMQDVPDQGAIQRKMEDSNKGEQMQNQVMPRGKLGESGWRFDTNLHQRRRSQSTGKVDKGTKTTAVVRTRADKKTKATALTTATADKKTNAIAVLNGRADNTINENRALWPYERRN